MHDENKTSDINYYIDEKSENGFTETFSRVGCTYARYTQDFLNYKALFMMQKQYLLSCPFFLQRFSLP